MSWEQRNNDFCTAQTNAQMAYIEAEREVVRLQAENARLRETLSILWFCQQFATDCDDCKLNDGDGKILEPCAQCACDSLCDRMRELGVTS